MNSCLTKGKRGHILAIGVLAFAATCGLRAAESTRPTNYQSGAPIAQKWAAALSTQSAPSRHLVLWDTLSPLGDKVNPEARSGWKAVPNDLLLLETDPPKASSDPGYYGREYSLKGDAVVETPALTAVFSATKGCVKVYSRQDSLRRNEGSEPAEGSGDPIVTLSPSPAEGKAAIINHVEVLRNADDEIVLKVTFSAPGLPPNTGIFSFDKSGILAVEPNENMNRVRLTSPMAYGIAPGFIGDDLIYGGSQRLDTNFVAVPAENLFLGLQQGEASEWVMTWPQGKQRVNLRFEQEHGEPMIRSVDFDTGEQSFYLAALSAPGIWHKETLTADYLEKDVKARWKPPFPAKWKTQLYEEDLKTTYAFRESRGTVWRGVAGSYDYPVWFSGEDAFYRLGKKVQPKGESVIYFLEGRDTPRSLLTPAEILKETLGRQAAEPILDAAGRKLRTHHRRGAVGVRRACTCGCTEAIQAVFEAGEEASRKDEIQGALDDMIYFVHCHVERINEYRQFAAELLKTIEEKRQSAPDLKPFLDNLEEIVRQIPQECEVQKENMKDFGYADNLSRKTMALTGSKDASHLKAYMELLKAWRAMGGAQDYVVAKCHTITRNLCQAAGYGCAALPNAVPVAEQIRARCRQTLRNPDGYEIWPDY